MVDYPGEMNVKSDELARLRKALDDLEALPPLEQARAVPGVIDLAKKTLSRHRGHLFASLAGPGRPMSIAALARELGITRGKIDDAIASARRT